jgi:hypothetical protein
MVQFIGLVNGQQAFLSKMNRLITHGRMTDIQAIVISSARRSGSFPVPIAL